MRVSGFSHPMTTFRTYSAHADERARLANVVALVVASNQPFYPLYVHWAVSPVVLPVCLTFLSTPFFLAVPALMRRDTLVGRATLLFAGIGNTLLCRAVLGPSSGVEVFLLPCLALAGLLFRRSEWRFTLGFAAAAFAIYLLPADWLPAPLHLYDEAEYAAMRRLNFLSAASLTAMIAYLFSGAADGARGGEEIRDASATVRGRDDGNRTPPP